MNVFISILSGAIDIPRLERRKECTYGSGTQNINFEVFKERESASYYCKEVGEMDEFGDLKLGVHAKSEKI